MADSTKEIVAAIESLKKSLTGRGSGGAGASAGSTPITITTSNEELEKFNKSLVAQREGIDSLKEDLASLEEGSREYLELQKELLAQTNDYNEAVGETAKKLKAQRDAQDSLSEAMDDAREAVVGLSSKMNDVQSFARELERTGGASKELSRMSIQLGDDLRLSGVSYEEVTQATKALVATTTDFTMLSADMQKSLTTDAALFKEVGVSNETYAKNMQIGMKKAGLSTSGAADAMREIRKTALALEVPINDLMEDVGGVEEKIAQLGVTGFDTFNEMARIQKITGLEMGKLINMTDKFDTFEGAAKQAGSLNAALGGNFVDSMSLMMEDDPAERFKMIREAIESSGVAVEDMTRKQKMFMASAAGFENVSDFADAMSGDLSSLQEEVAEAQTGDTVQSLEDSARYIRSQTELAANAAKALEPAYGILGTKAMEVTDKVAPVMFAAAMKLNQAQKWLAKKTPPWAAAAMGSAEALDNLGKKISEIFSGLKGVLITAIAMPKKFWGLLKGTWNILKGTKTRIADTFGWFTGKGKYAGKLNFFEKIQFKAMQVGEKLQKFGNISKNIGNKILKPFKTAFNFLKGAPTRIAGFLQKIPGVGKVITRVLGSGVTAIASIGNMIYEGFKGVRESLNTEGNTLKDHIFSWFLGVGKGAAEAINYLTFGLLDKFSSMTNSLGMGFMEAWEALDFSELGLPFIYAFELMRDAVYDFLGIASPSKLMMEIGMNMIDGLIEPIENAGATLAKVATVLLEAFLAPWATIGSLLMEVIQPALDMVPDSIKSIFMGDTADTANNLQTAATPQGRDDLFLDPNTPAGGAAGQPQVINISLMLDGKEIDKKVINLLGGIAKEAVL